MNEILKYFPNITATQHQQFAQLQELYTYWNAQINVISRKDIERLYLHHVLHSLSIAKVIDLKSDTNIMDVGCGGGFPGIPLAIMFPDCEFYLIDSIGKKIKVVNEIATALNLKNVTAEHVRVQQVKKQFDFVVSRAVTAFPKFVAMVRKNISKTNRNDLNNGILYIKGGDFMEEIVEYGDKVRIFDCTKFFDESFFETKKVIHLQL